MTDYKEETKEHCLTYDINTENESFEWVVIEELNDREFQSVGRSAGGYYIWSVQIEK